MCGIAGSINCITDKSDLNLISHRGPDYQQLVYVGAGPHSVYLGHTRLSILDLSEAGNQPMFTPCGYYGIVFNGEIYNHEELRKRLTGVRFKGHSDTETILHYISQYGIGSVKDFNGIFGFAYLDLKEQTLHIVRDRFGVKPLYYCFENNQFSFSSEMRVLKKQFKPTLHTGVLLQALKMRYTPSPLTIFSEIHKAEPGQIISCSLAAGEIKINKHYFIRQGITKRGKKDNKSVLLNTYGDLFERAVRRQLMADVEVGVLLSGGVDSALVAAVAKNQSPSPIKAFTIGFDEDPGKVDEIDYARQTASFLGIEHYCSRVGVTDLFGSYKKIVKIVEEPIGTTSIIPMYYLSELAASHVKVVLSGQGADEPLGGYKKYRYLNLIHRFRKTRVLAPVAKAAGTFYKGNEKYQRLLSAVSSKDIVRAYAGYNSIMSDTEIFSLLHPGKRDVIEKEYKQVGRQINSIWKNRFPMAENVEEIFPFYDLRTSLADDLLMYTDKITMNFGLECRVPVLDNDLVEFIESLETFYKYNSRVGKIIHKDFAREYLPAEITERQKLGFQSPVNFWFRRNTQQLEEIFSSGEQFSKLFSRTAISRLLKQHAAGSNLEKQIFLLLSIFYLMEDHYESIKR